MTSQLAAAFLTLLLAGAAPAPCKPLFDPKPATIDGVRYAREQVFEGDYLLGFEASIFRPIGRRDEMWLSGWTDTEVAKPGALPMARLYHIRFIGRRTARPGRYGHLGAYRDAVIITEMIDARPKAAP